MRRQIEAIRAAFEVLEEGVLISDRSGSVIAANRAAAEILGVPLDTILGGHPARAAEIGARFVGGTEIGEQNSVALRVLRTGRPERGRLVEFEHPTSGERRVIRVSVQPLFRKGEDEPWGVVGSFVNLTEREHELSELAFRDPLTGLANRRVLEDHLRVALARAQRTGRSLGLLFFDIDGLKGINDTLGHAAGDELLRAIAERLRRTVRTGDVAARSASDPPLVGRLGGDEFLLLLADVEGDIAVIVDSVRGRIHDALTAPFTVAGRQLRIRASFGASAYPNDGETSEALLAHADAAMYAMKRAGGGTDP